MTINSSNKIRAVGGASVLAITAGLAMPASAQMAAEPVLAAPTPMPMPAPGNVEECALVSGVTLVCAPGTDADGFTGAFNGLGVDVQAGSQVQGTISLLANTNAVIDGEVVTFLDGEGGLEFGGASTITNNGLIQTNGDFFAIAVSVDFSMTLINNGTISTTGDVVADAVVAGDNSFVTNNGLIVTNGEDAFAVILGDDSGLTNALEASIITGGDFSLAVTVGDNFVFDNAGLIQTFGDFAPAVDAGDNATITNSGFIFTTGDGSTGVGVGDNSTVTNVEGGSIFTFGDGLASVIVGEDSTITNDGEIITRGDSAVAIALGNNGVFTNGATGEVTTTGSDSAAVVINGDGTVTNAGLIQATGNDAAGIVVIGEATITNDGTITTDGERAIDLAGTSTVTNTGTILARGSDTIRFAENDSVLDNSGTIASDFGFGSAVNSDGRSGLTVTNTGLIRGGGRDGIIAGVDATITNEGTISGDRHGVNAGTGVTLTNAEGAEISATGDSAVIAATGAVINNAGTITSDATGVETMGGDITNTGSISGDTGVFASAGTLFNSADGTITGATDGVRSFGTGSLTVTNEGTITGGTVAVALGNGDDTLIRLNDGTETGEIDGGAGDDVFAFIVTDETDREFLLDDLGTVIANFEDFRVGSQTFDFANGSLDAPVATGVITLTGTTGSDFTVVNTAILDGTSNGTVSLIAGADEGIAREFTITENGSIDTTTGDALVINAEGFTVTNDGAIATSGGGTIAINDTAGGATIISNGTIDTAGENTAAVFLADGSSFTTNGAVTTAGDAGVGVVAGEGSTVTVGADGSITTVGTTAAAVVFSGDSTLVNNGTIEAAGTDATIFLLNGGTITNGGTISAVDGVVIDIAFAATVENLEGGSIISTNSDGVRFNSGGSELTNNGSIEADTGVVGSDGDDFVANFGSITGATTAASLGAGADTFQQWTGATVTGDVDLGDGDDTFVLEGNLGSIDGMVLGGAGNNTAVLGGVLDVDGADVLDGFQTNTLGTLFDLQISGDRTLEGDIIIDGTVNLGLGVDTLTNDGMMTLESTGVVNILTPLDSALLGQTVLVLEDGTGFVDNGGTINVIDDDALLTYTPIVGSLSVQVGTVNPLANSGDSNLATFGGVLENAVIAGTISAANFAAINGLGTEAAVAAVAADALPSLSGGVGRELFEASSLASHALDRHLATGEKGIWGQIAYRGASQDVQSLSADGYDADTISFTVGGDIPVMENANLGVLFNYSDIDIDDEAGNIAREENDVESFKFGAYLAWAPIERSFINFEVAYLVGDIDSNRGGFFGPISSSYDFDGFQGRITAGYDVLPSETLSLTPTIGINAARFGFDDATETGGFGFLVERGEAGFTELRGGLEFAGQFSETISGFVGGTYIEDVDGDTRSFVVNSSELNSFALVLPERDDSRFEIAAGLDAAVGENFTIAVGYLGDFASGYDAHAARVTGRITF
ncbi:MAG: autotransporter domain-containing protein [Pseudomonadota bacterium]